MTPRMRSAATITVGTALLLSLPVGAGAADDGRARSQLTLKGQPLTHFVLIEPMSPFVAVEPGLVSLEAQGGGAQQTDDNGERGGSRRRSVLIGGAVGLGLGIAVGAAPCCNEGNCGCPYTALGGLGGFAFGALIGALLGN